jgi:urease accessory protein UreF
LWGLRDAIARALTDAALVIEPADLAAQALAHEIDALTHRSLDGRLFAS